MDGVSNSVDEKVVVIGATNRPQELDEAVRRRMTKRIMIDLPSDAARRGLIEHLIRSHSPSLTDKQMASVIKKSVSYSCSDISALCKEAAMFPIRSLTPQQLSTGQIPNITMEHFTRAFQVVKPSVSAKSLEFYRKWNEEFGSS
jgi:spastin